ncbi:hypothetical protein LSTR_LSTR014135 [Laodelphax striatellus]|uniref:MADF domain-containing protein n=1 Tax=Laodelphax striatellus TaxID=195883 RepID=A0A482XBF1_LAOST|nr:hypothetical protein LSTR_LSTR014135 [Laodelphax striatellus]
MAPRWDEELTMRFLELYKQHPCLWDQFSPLYKLKKARDTALAKIVFNLNIHGFGVAEAKLKIKSLRSTYLGEVSKMNKSGSGTDDVYKSNLRWLPLMEDIMEKGTRKSQKDSTMMAVPPSSVHDGYDYLGWEGEPPAKRKLSTDLESNDESLAEVAASASNEEENNDSNSSMCLVEVELGPSPKKRDRPRSKIEMIANTARQLASLKNSFDKPENEHDVFGKHVGAQLKALSPKQAIVAMSKINSVLTDCRLADLVPAPCKSTRKT